MIKLISSNAHLSLITPESSIILINNRVLIYDQTNLKMLTYLIINNSDC